MIIKSLKLHNFGVYAGDNEFSFEGKKPIVLIGGMNGRGKTTFLEAILLALYGSNSFAYVESEYKVYTQYLRSFVNRDAIDNLCWIELEFDIQSGDGIEKYRIIREWEGFSKRLNESLLVYKDGEYSEFLTNNWSMFVENILPSALSNLFIFDGEKIAELAVDTSNEQLKKAIRSMLGISVLDVVKNDVLRNLKRINKDASNNDLSIELNNIRDKKESISIQLEELASERDRIQMEMVSNNSKKEMLVQMYSSRGGIAEEKRQETMQKKSDCTSELAMIEGKLVEYASNDLPLLLVKDLLIDVKEHAEIENEEMILRKSLNQINALQKQYSKGSPKKKAESLAFVEFINKTANEQHTEQIYALSDYSLFQLTDLIENKMDESSNDVISILKREKVLEEKIGEYDSYLNLDINTQELSEINEEIRRVDAQIIKSEMELSSISEKITTLEARLREITKEFNHALESYLANAEYQDGASRTTKYSEMLINIIDKYLIELQRRKAELLGITITDCYKNLASKRSLIGSITVDPETLDYTFYSDNGIVVPKDSLSAGEQQIMIISILWALAICAKQKLPVIIDTPLSRLDSSHRKTIIKKYFPHASQQTIILSTDSEVDKRYYQMMKNDIGDEYTLVYDEKTKSTSIKKGYELGE